jgi:hypothetical protein
MTGPMDLPPSKRIFLSNADCNIVAAKQIAGYPSDFGTERCISVYCRDADQVQFRRFRQKSQGKNVVNIGADIRIKDHWSHSFVLDWVDMLKS